MTPNRGNLRSLMPGKSDRSLDCDGDLLRRCCYLHVQLQVDFRACCWWHRCLLQP